jgi:hypothetical protein
VVLAAVALTANWWNERRQEQKRDDALRELVGSIPDAPPGSAEVASCVTDGPTTEARGTVENTGTKSTGYRLYVRFLAPDDSLVDSDTAFTDELDPGETGRWEASGFGHDIDSCHARIEAGF